MFSCEFCKVFKKTVFTERIWATAFDTFQNLVTARRKDHVNALFTCIYQEHMITSKEGAKFSIVINK